MADRLTYVPKDIMNIVRQIHQRHMKDSPQAIKSFVEKETVKHSAKRIKTPPKPFFQAFINDLYRNFSQIF